MIVSLDLIDLPYLTLYIIGILEHWNPVDGIKW